MLATFGAKLTTAVVQPTFQAIAAGVLAGAITGGALIVAGVVPPPGPPRTALLACPGSGAVVANVPAGQSLLAVARSEDGAWLEIYIGRPGIDGAWAPAAAVHLQGSTDGLPVADCAAPSSAEPTPQALPSPAPSVAGTIEPTLEPAPSQGPTLSPGVTASPTPKPTSTPKVTAKPTPTMTPLPPPPTLPPTDTPAPVNHPPSVSGLGASPTCIDNGSTYTQSVVTATAIDTDVGDSLTVKVRIGRIYNGLQYYNLNGTKTMARVGSSDQYTYTITQSLLVSFGWNSATADSEITYDVTATDSHGVKSTTVRGTIQLFYNSYSGCIIF